MNAYLAKLRRLVDESGHDSPLTSGFEGFEGEQGSCFSRDGLAGDQGEDSVDAGPFGKITTSGNPQNPQNLSSAYAHTMAALGERCPDMVEVPRWRRAEEDGRGFLATWGRQAAALGWTSKDLFGLHSIPERPARNYRRLSRYDETGLIWLLQGRPVIALTDATAAIKNPTGAVATYRRYNKPALGPVGDSLDDLDLRGEP
jgi:hypothetical protein